MCERESKRQRQSETLVFQVYSNLSVRLMRYVNVIHDHLDLALEKCS